MWHSRPPRDPAPPFMANAILNFHFDFLNPSLSEKCNKVGKKYNVVKKKYKDVQRKYEKSIVSPS